MKNKVAWMLSFLSIIVFLLSSFSLTVKAEEVLGFTYELIMPDNQIGEATYFDLMVKPGQEQTLKILLTNLTSEKKTIDVSINEATTGSSGVINYAPNKVFDTFQESSNIKLREMIDAPKDVMLKPNEKKELSLKLTIPNKPFNGLILGGVELKEKQNVDAQKSSKGMSLKNEYSYIFTIALQESKNKVEPNISFGETRYEDIGVTEIINESRGILENVEVKSILSNQSDNKILLENSQKNIRMAPYSTMLYLIPETETLSEGEYKIETTVTYGEQNWKNESTIKIEEKKSKEPILIQSSEQKTKLLDFVLPIMISLLVTTIVIMLFMLNKKNFKKKKKIKK